MIRIARSLWCGCRLSELSTLDTLAHEASNWSQQLFHRQTQPYFDGNSNIFAEVDGPFGKFANMIQNEKSTTTNFHFYGKQLLSLLKQQIKGSAPQTSSKKSKILLKKFYQIRKTLCQQAYLIAKRRRIVDRKDIGSQLSFKSEFSQSVKVYFHLMCKFQNEYKELESVSFSVMDAEQDIAYFVINWIRNQNQQCSNKTQPQENIQNYIKNISKDKIKDLREYLIQQIKKLPQDKYPSQLKNQILNLFELDKGYVVFKSLVQDRMRQGAIKGKINIFNPISSVTSKVFEMIFSGSKNVSIIGSKKIGKSYSILLAYLLSKYTAKPIFYFSHINNITIPDYFAKRLFEYAYIQLSKEQIQKLAQLYNEKFVQRKQYEVQRKKIVMESVYDIFASILPKTTIIDQCNYLTASMKEPTENTPSHNLNYYYFCAILRQLDSKTKIVLSSSINVENSRIRKIVVTQKNQKNPQQWRQLFIEQQITDKDNLKQCFKFVLQNLIKQKQIDNKLSLKKKKIKQIMNSKQLEELLQKITRKFDGLNYANIKAGAQEIITLFHFYKQFRTDLIFEIIVNAIINQKLDQFIKQTDKWLNRKSEQSVNSLPNYETRVKNINRLLIYHQIDQKLDGEVRQNYPLYVLGKHNKLHPFIEKNHREFFQQFVKMTQKVTKNAIKVYVDMFQTSLKSFHGYDNDAIGKYLESMVHIELNSKTGTQYLNAYAKMNFEGLSKKKKKKFQNIAYQSFDYSSKNQKAENQKDKNDPKDAIGSIDPKDQQELMSSNTKLNTKSEQVDQSKKRKKMAELQEKQKKENIKSTEYLAYNKFMMKKMYESCLADQDEQDTIIRFYRTAISQKKLDTLLAYKANSTIYFVFNEIGLNKTAEQFPAYVKFADKLISQLIKEIGEIKVKEGPQIKWQYWMLSGNIDLAIAGKKLQTYYAKKDLNAGSPPSIQQPNIENEASQQNADNKKNRQEKSKLNHQSNQAYLKKQAEQNIKKLTQYTPEMNLSQYAKCCRVMACHPVQLWSELKNAFQQKYKTDSTSKLEQKYKQYLNM